MKKIIAIVLAALMVCAMLAGCGGKEEAGLKTVEPGKLIMATNAAFPPYEFIEGNEIVGIDAEIAGAIAEKLGLELQIDDMEFDSIVESVKGGKADIGLAGMTVTPEREEQISFTLGDSLGMLDHAGGFTMLTMDTLRERIEAHPQGTEGFLREMAEKYRYVEAQLWDDAPCAQAEIVRLPIEKAL